MRGEYYHFLSDRCGLTDRSDTETKILMHHERLTYTSFFKYELYEQGLNYHKASVILEFCFITIDFGKMEFFLTDFNFPIQCP